MSDLVFLVPENPKAAGMGLYLVGDDVLSGGDARWEEVDRPRRRTATEWVGSSAHRLMLPLLHDGADTNASVEQRIARMARWVRPTKETGQPPLMRVAGPVKTPGYGCLWVIDKLEWDQQCQRKADGRRIQQGVTVTLLEHTAAEVLLGPAAAARARAGV